MNNSNGMLATATVYLERGFCPVQIHPKEKEPVLKAWQKLRFKSADELKPYFSDACNIGVHLGDASGNIVDVDLDHELAVQLAPAYLPPTRSVFGRPGKPRSHFLYRVTEKTPTKKWKLPKSHGRKMIVELRSTGAQTVVPPSIHPSGERIEWACDEEPAEIHPENLIAQLHALADEVLRQSGIERESPKVHHASCPVDPAGRDIVERARKYLATLPPAISGQSGHDATYHAACILILGFGLDHGQAISLLSEWNQRCQPPWSERELEHKISDVEKRPDERGYLVRSERQGIQRNRDEPDAPFTAPVESETATKRISPIAFGQLATEHPTMRPPIVHGLLRIGEVGNIVSVSKVGKSWLAAHLALCVITNRKFIESFDCVPAKVLYVDNELHPPTIVFRIKAVAEAMGIRPEEYQSELDILSLRGKQCDLNGLANLLEPIEPGDYGLLIADAWYRFIPPNASENDNAAVMAMYNKVDAIVDRLQCACVNVHHSSKGGQSDKRISDVGSGAGAQSRAADSHLILREHEEDGAVVFDGVVRSFPPVEPIPLRWTFPLWRPDSSLDPKRLKGKLTVNEQRQSERDNEGIGKLAAALEQGPATVKVLLGRTGFGLRRAERLLNQLEAAGSVSWTEVTKRGNACRVYQSINLDSQNGHAQDPF